MQIVRHPDLILMPVYCQNVEFLVLYKNLSMVGKYIFISPPDFSKLNPQLKTTVIIFELICDIII